jgi:hypothetical protein
MVLCILGINNALPQTDQLDNILVQYFAALRTGNLQMLRSLLSDELLKQRNETFSNPRYSEFLKSIYGHVEFKIINTTQLNDNQISVDIEVTSDTQTQMKETITFIKQQGEWKLHKDRKDNWN